MATLIIPKAGDSIDNLVKTPPTQAGNSGGKRPPTRPTYQGPDGDDKLHYTVLFVPGRYPAERSSQPNNYHGKVCPQDYINSCN